MNEKIEHPIVIVPGFMASCLYTNSNYKVWPATWPFSIRKLAIKNKLKSKGLVPAYYSGLMKFLHSKGYEEGKTLFIFSNDWRQSVETNGNLLYEFVKKLQSENGFGSVDIINHSMGGLMTRRAHKLGASIARTIYIASPHYGMHTAYLMSNPSLSKYYISSWLKQFLGSSFKVKLAGPYIAGTKKLEKMIKDIVSDFPSVYDLLPDKFYFQNQPLVNDNKSMEETYFGDNDNIGPWNFPNIQHNEVRRSMRFKEHLGKDLPGNSNLVIYSDDIPTQDRIFWSQASSLPTYKDSGLHGDETIGTKSLKLEGGNPNGLIKKVAGIHQDVQNKRETHDIIYQFLNST